MIKNLIFDFDGVIADTFPFAVEAALDINKDLKLLTTEKVEPEKARGTDMAEFISFFKIPKWKLLLFILKYRKKLIQKIEGIPTFSGIPEVLTELKKRTEVLGIVTSNQKSIVEKFLKSKGIKEFDFIYSTIDLLHKEKRLLKALDKFKLIKEETLYIGDETRDIKAARGAGLKIASVTWGYNFENKLTEFKPDFIVNRPQDLLNLIQ